MEPNHRDRIAFLRLCSGHFKRGAKLKHSRSGKTINVHNPVLFLARDRELAEEAWPGDIIGIPNHGNLNIGDALTERSEEHTSELQSLMRISYAVFCLKKNNNVTAHHTTANQETQHHHKTNPIT